MMARLESGELPGSHVAVGVLGEVGADDGLGVGVLAVPGQGPHLLLGNLLILQAEQEQVPGGGGAAASGPDDSVDHLASAGFAGAPRVLGVEDGREILT